MRYNVSHNKKQNHWKNGLFGKTTKKEQMLMFDLMRGLKKFLALFVLIGVLFSQDLSPKSEAIKDTIRINSGLISGVTLQGNVHVYKGIPFASPPVGTLRWRPPQPARPWKGVRPAIEFGPACYQPSNLGPISRKKYEKMSEDCLYLNVWTPAKYKNDSLPVMFWIHGGAFMAGSASDAMYDGQDLALKGVVVVTADYRLGPFGFFAHPLLSKESPNGVSGNYGLLDLIAALKWVQENIHEFGGDPNRVTIFGESAGGRSVGLLMISPLARGLFHRAIMQSCSEYRPIYHLKKHLYKRPSMEEVGIKLSTELGCENTKYVLACLRSKTPEEILKAANPGLAGFAITREKNTPYEPAVDGWVIPKDPSDLFDEGQQASVPVIVGFNANEGSLFIRHIPARPRVAEKLIKSAFGPYAQEVLNLVGLNLKTETRHYLDLIVGYMTCGMPILNTARAMDAIEAPVWLYYYSHVQSNLLGWRYGAYHGAEIRFVFNNLDKGRLRVTSNDRKLAEIMSSYWVQFATTGNPNNVNLPHWPQYHSNNENYIEFGDTVKVKKVLPHKNLLNLFTKIEKERRMKKLNPLH